MVTEGKPVEQVRLATGWERGADGKWRYEVPDLKFKDGTIKPLQERNDDFEVSVSEGLEVRLHPNPLDFYLERLESEAPAAVVRDFMKTEMQGRYVRCDVKDLGVTDVSFSSRTIGETVSQWSRQRPANQKEVARRLLVASDQINVVLEEGRRTEWESSDQEDKHVDEKFTRYLKMLEDPSTGESFFAVVVLKRKERQKPTPYLVNVSGTRGFHKMLRRQQFETISNADGVLYEVSIECIYIA